MRVDRTQKWVQYGLMENMNEYLITELQERKPQWRTIAEMSGVPFRTLEKIGRMNTKNPRLETVQRLMDFFKANPR